MAGERLVCPLVPCCDVYDSQFDGVIIVTDSIDKLANFSNLSGLQEPLKNYQNVDAAFGKDVVLVHCPEVPSKRVIFSPTGPLNRDFDDVRRFGDAGVKGLKRALQAGCKAPLFVRPIDDSFKLAGMVATLGALHAAYVPLEIREADVNKAKKLEKLGVWCDDMARVTQGCNLITALESGRIVARDIGGSDPERMAAPNVAEYVQNLFQDSCVKVKVISDLPTLEKRYPLLVAVNRAASFVTRHQARVIWLEYEGDGPIEQTLMLIGKGVTYDTGGLDIKAGGVMAGMHRDKCGAAAVAGFMQVLSALKPKGLKVIAGMAMVRNSCGSEGYVSDEIITSRAGVRVRVGNTDAEGRMAMTDLLCEAKERAQDEKNPSLFTIATLTGHAIRAMGPHYSIILDNGPARNEMTAYRMQEAGDLIGDLFELSTLRRDDYEFHTGKSEYEDVLQSNNAPSTMTNRGHQTPAAFMIMASGLDKHGLDSDKQLRYSHIDIAGSSGPFPGVPTGAPILALAQRYVVDRLK